MRHLPSPHQLKSEFPLSAEESDFLLKTRKEAAGILRKQDSRFAVLVGPCSIHDPDLALKYAERLQRLAPKVPHLFLVMRLFLEKPRTRLGWKGILYDPFLDGTNDIAAGLRISRKLLSLVAKMGVPAAVEILDPLAALYFDDLISWGLIGARTSASQPHRQLASDLPFPIGFKNDISGEIDVAIDGILSSKSGHSFLSLDLHGQIVGRESIGNPLTHLVLRGSDKRTNYDPISVAKALEELKKHHLEERLLIDCSHGNSNRDPKLQKVAFHSVVEQRRSGNRSIVGAMLESHLLPGKQPLGENPGDLRYGVSITDACLGWEETEDLLLFAEERVLSKSMSSVQN